MKGSITFTHISAMTSVGDNIFCMHLISWLQIDLNNAVVTCFQNDLKSQPQKLHSCLMFLSCWLMAIVAYGIILEQALFMCWINNIFFVKKVFLCWEHFSYELANTGNHVMLIMTVQAQLINGVQRSRSDVDASNYPVGQTPLLCKSIWEKYWINPINIALST